MARDWRAWHEQYDDPEWSVSRRLEVVRDQVRAQLSERPTMRRIISMCAGDGRDVLPVLAETAPGVEALLVELDPQLADGARRTALDLGLRRVVVRTEDAGSTNAYRGCVPADLVLACGVFGNVSDADVERTVQALRTLLSDDGVVIWTRGSNVPADPTTQPGDPSEHVRRLFARAGFEELAFLRPDDASYRVGVHRLVGPAEGFVPDLELFTFL